jgi:hypothetical protein
VCALWGEDDVPGTLGRHEATNVVEYSGRYGRHVVKFTDNKTLVRRSSFLEKRILLSSGAPSFLLSFFLLMGNAQAVAASGALDPRQVETLENRARAMEERIAELEKATTTPGPVAAVPPAAGSASAQSTAAHEMEVQRLRDALAAAEGGNQEMVAKVHALEEANSKLAYQVMHLKRNYRLEA